MKKNAAFEEKSGILFLKNVHFLIFTFRFSGRGNIPKYFHGEQTCILFNSGARIWFYQVSGLFIYSRDLEFYALSLSKVLKIFQYMGIKVGKIVQFVI